MRPNLVVVSPWPPWYGGGIERTVGEVAKRLKRDFNIVIYCTNTKPGLYSWEDIPVYVFRGYTTAYHFSLSMYNALKKAKFDLIHAHCFTSFMPLAVSRIAKNKFIFNPHFHHMGSTLLYRMLKKIYDPVAGYHFFRNASLIVCNSVAEKDLILDRFQISNEIEVIYNGVDTNRIKNAKPFDIDGKLILYVGRVEKYKNIEVAIQAVKHLPREHHLYVIGKGSYEGNLKGLTDKLGLNDRVRFLGYLTDEEVYRWLKTCSVFIHLSEIESFGMTCLEALAAGKPVIANDDHFGLKETADLFKGNIFTVNAKEILPHELSKLIEDTIQVQVNANLHDFDWNTIAERFKEAYIHILQNS